MTKSMEQIHLHRVKELQLQHMGPYQISKEVGMGPKTVRKYMEQEVFSPKAPTMEQQVSKLDPYKNQVETWLKEDEQNQYKKRPPSGYMFDWCSSIRVSTVLTQQ